MIFLSEIAADATMPLWMKWVSWIAAMLVAAAVITKYIMKASGCIEIIRVVIKELSPNGGSSIKDKIDKTAAAVAAMKLPLEQAAKDSQTAIMQNAELQKSADIASRRLDGTERKIENVGTKLDQTIKSFHDEKRDGEKRMARLIIHESRGDLQASSLLQEEKDALARIIKEEADEE